MKSFNVIHFEFNSDKFKSYDIMPHLIYEYNKLKDKPKSFKDIKEFIKKESMYQWWSRTEYEIILVDWLCQKVKKKIDIYDQILMNLDIITEIFVENISK